MSQMDNEAMPDWRHALVSRIFSSGDAENPVDETHLSDDIAFRQPADLTFANDVHGLVSRDAAQCAVHRGTPDSLPRVSSQSDDPAQ